MKYNPNPVLTFNDMKNFLLLFVATLFISLSPVFGQEDNADKDSTVKITMNDGTVRNGYIVSEDDNEILFMDNKIGKIFITKANIKYHAENGGSGPTDVLTTTDGTVRVGYIISDDGREVLFMDNTIGKVYIPKEKIKSIIPFSQSVESLGQTATAEFTGPEGPFTTRYYFTTNALPIKKGENYAMIHLYGPEVHFALSDRLSLGFMTTWVASPFILAAKYTIPTKNEKLNFGLGTMMGTSGYLGGFSGWGGMHWGMITVGDRLKNFTFSAGYSYVNAGRYGSSYPEPGTYPAVTDEWGTNFDYNLPDASSTISTPIIGFGGIARVGKKASFIFDSMIFFPTERKGSESEYFYGPGGIPVETVVTETGGGTTNVFAFIMPGMRFQSSPNKAFQFALAGVMNSSWDIAVPIPMVSWFKKF